TLGIYLSGSRRRSSRARGSRPQHHVRRCADSAGYVDRHAGLDADDGQEVFDASEVVDIARVEGQVGGYGGGRDQQIDGPGTARFTPSGDNRRVDTSIGSGSVAIERQRVEGGLGSLWAILTSRSLGGVTRRV